MSNSESTYAQALALEEEGRHREAKSLYQKLVRISPEDPRFFIAYGVCLQHLGQWRESAKLLQQGIDLKPHYCEGDARLFLAESLLRIGEKKKAVEQWKIVADMEPEYPSYEAVPNEAKQKLREHHHA